MKSQNGNDKKKCAFVSVVEKHVDATLPEGIVSEVALKMTPLLTRKVLKLESLENLQLLVSYFFDEREKIKNH